MRFPKKFQIWFEALDDDVKIEMLIKLGLDYFKGDELYLLEIARGLISGIDEDGLDFERKVEFVDFVIEHWAGDPEHGREEISKRLKH